MINQMLSMVRGKAKYYRFAAAAFVLVALSLLPGSNSLLKSVEHPDPEIYLYCDGTFPTSQGSINFSFSGRYIKKISFKLMRVGADEVMEASGGDGEQNIKKKQFKTAELVKEWKSGIAGKRNGDWRSSYGSFLNPGPGFYILYATEGNTTTQTGFIVTDIAVISKRDGNKALFLVVDRFKGTPITTAKVSAYKEGKAVFTKTTDEHGFAIYDDLAFSNERMPVLASSGNQIAIMDVNYWWYNPSTGYKFYTVTDRPVYRPGHTMYFKSTVRKSNGSLYSLPEDKEALVTINDPKGNQVYKETLPLNENGSCAGSLTFGDEPPIGAYNIIVTAGGQTGYQSFMVEEYRKPEYEVTVTPDVPVAIQGNKIKFRVEAKYYFGEPVKDAELTYSVARTRRWSWFYWGSRYSWYYDDEPYYYNYGGETVTTGSAKTDDKGAYEVEVKTEKLDSDVNYTLTAHVTDKGRRQISGSGTALAARAEFNMQLYSDKYSYKPADKVRLTATATANNGEKLKGKSIEFSISKVEWLYTKNYERKTTHILTRTAETGADGEAFIDFTPDMMGYFEVTGTSKDSLGNTVTSSTSFYVTSPNDTNVYYYSGGTKVIMDKDSYAVGDTARALITTNMPGASALVTVEATSIYKHAVIDMPNGSALFEFAVTPEMQPNAFVSVSLIKDNNFSSTQQNVVIPPVEKFLKVEILPDKKEYRPGDPAKITVKVTDKDGKPAPDVELSLGVVDESIYALRQENVPDSREFFYGKRWNNVQTSCSLWFYGRGYADDVVSKSSGGAAGLLAEAAPAAPMDRAMAKDEKKRDGDNESYAEAKIRTDFRDTAKWEAQLVTGADGTVSASLTMPDSLTTWRATARAISRETKVGNSAEKTIVRKNLLVRLETPRFFTQNDVQNITTVVHNYLPTAKNVRCQLHAKGLKLSDAGDKVISVPAGGDVRVEWHAVVEAPQTAWVTVKALTDEESDAMQLDIPVLPHGSSKWSAVAAELTGASIAKEIALPATAIKGATSLRLSLSPSIASTMFESLDYLIGYPYGCVEQTMSRFLPDVVVEQALQKMGLPKTEQMKELPKMVKQGLERLKTLQHGDGGWGWWEHDETHPFMTAYVIYGLTQAKKADYMVDENGYKRGIEKLSKMSASEKDFNTGAYMLFALDAAGEKNLKLMDTLREKYKKLNPYSQALLAIVLENNGRHDQALAVIRELEKNAKTSATSARWEGQSFHYSWMDNVVETTAFVLKALLRVDPDNELITKSVRYLALSRNGDHWYSTKDTAAAILALTDYMLIKEDLKPDTTVTVKVNGHEVLKRRFTRDDVFKPSVELIIEDKDGSLKPGVNKISIERESGTGKIYFTGSLKYFESSGEIKASNSGIPISRYYSFDAEGKKKLKKGTKLKPGTEIYVHISVKPATAYEYAIVEDMLPSGFEVVKEEHDNPYYYGGWRWWYPHKEIRDEKVAFFATNMYERIYELSYRIRAEVPGEVSALPARVWLMYFPEIGGNSSEFRFLVAE